MLPKKSKFLLSFVQQASYCTKRAFIYKRRFEASLLRVVIGRSDVTVVRSFLFSAGGWMMCRRRRQTQADFASFAGTQMMAYYGILVVAAAAWLTSFALRANVPVSCIRRRRPSVRSLFVRPNDRRSDCEGWMASGFEFAR